MEKLIAAELAPATAGAPELDWAHDDLTVVWAEHDRDVACAALETVESAAAHDGRTFADMEAAAAAAGGTLHGAAFFHEADIASLIFRVDLVDPLRCQSHHRCSGRRLQFSGGCHLSADGGW